MNWLPIETAPRDQKFLATNGVLVGIGEFTDEFTAKAFYAFDQSIEPHTFGAMIRFKPTHYMLIEKL